MSIYCIQNDKIKAKTLTKQAYDTVSPPTGAELLKVPTVNIL